MKIAFILLIVSIFQVNAASYGQNVSLHVKNASLEEVFNSLRQQSGYNFLYDSDVLNKTNKVTISLSNTSFTDALNQCLKNQPVTYSINDKNVVIRKKAAQAVTPVVTNAPASVAVITVTGLVSDEKGQPVPGATVTIKGQTGGTATAVDGKYSIKVSDGNQTLVFSSLGYEKQEVAINNRSVINVILKEASATLNDVVVIGYGTQRKKDVTGAVSSVKAADLDVQTSSNFLQSLQGKATGIQVTQSTGQPGAGVTIKIRSNPSAADPGVLYVIDGVVVNNSPATPASGIGQYGNAGLDQSPLNFINPNDIESIEILKDASSRAIYGAQAGAGVVLVTTKRGKTGKPTVQYSGSYAFQNVDKMLQVLGTKDYMTQRNLIGQETYLFKNKIAPYYGTVNQSAVTPYVPLYTQAQIDAASIQPNAMQAITRSGYTSQHDLSVSGTSNKTSYFISGNYFDQQGVILATGFKRWNGKASIDQALSDKVKVGVNLIGSNTQSTNSVTGGQNQMGGIITAALYYPANLPLQNADGSYPLNPTYTSIPNPLSFTTVTDMVKNQRLLTSAYATWEIINGLTAKANFSYDQADIKRNNYFPTTFSYGAQVNGIASLADNYSNTKQIDYTVNYKVPLGKKQSIDALAGYTYQLQNAGSLFASNQNFTSDQISYYNLGAGQAAKPTVGSSQNQVTYASYFARAIYQLDNRYTLQASIRRDGSSRFAANHKWGYFPAVSAGWIVSDESFLRSKTWLDLLKLRVGYGEIGNANFPASAFEVYGLGSAPNFGTGLASTGIYLTQAANPDLKWETAGELNVGLDFGFFKGRLTGSVDYFDKTIRNLITRIPYPADFLVSGVYGNAGTTKSTGYEIGIQTKNIVAPAKGGFTWSTNFNISHYLSYWKERAPQALATLDKFKAASGKDALFNPVYGYVAAGGLFTGTYGSAPSTMPNMLPGGIIISDIHGYDANGNLTGPDGKITAADQTLLGNADPQFNLGFGNTFSYKGFDLTVYFSGVIQHSWSPYAGNSYYRIALLDANMGTFGWNTLPISLQRWTFQNPNGTFPTGVSDPTYSAYQSNASYYYVNSSYLRCQNITLGYSLPASLLSRQKTVSSLRLSVDMQNAFVITKYPAIDPMLSLNNYYPLSRSFVIGLNATF